MPVLLGQTNMEIPELQDLQNQRIRRNEQRKNTRLFKPPLTGRFLASRHHHRTSLQLFIEVTHLPLRLLVGVVFFIFGIAANKTVWFFNRSANIDHNKYLQHNQIQRVAQQKIHHIPSSLPPRLPLRSQNGRHGSG